MDLAKNQEHIIDMQMFSESKILGEDHQPYVVKNLWSQNPAILVFLRHFGCIGCRAHAKDVWDNREKYKKAGAEIYFIGSGSPNLIKGFKMDLGISDAWIYTDPTLNIFKLAGFKSGIIPAMGPRAILNVIELKKKGHVDMGWEKEKGDRWQMGGIIAIKPGNVVTFYYASKSVGDVP